MAFIDTSITEAEAPRFNGYDFDIVQLTSLGSALGSRVWAKSTRLFAVEAGATAPRAAPQKRLLIAVDDDANDAATVQRVRGKLQWIGESSPCPF